MEVWLTGEEEYPHRGKLAGKNESNKGSAIGFRWGWRLKLKKELDREMGFAEVFPEKINLIGKLEIKLFSTGDKKGSERFARLSSHTRSNRGVSEIVGVGMHLDLGTNRRY